MTYIINDNAKDALFTDHTATFHERKRARLYYQALNALISANSITVEVYDNNNLLIADEITYIRG